MRDRSCRLAPLAITVVALFTLLAATSAVAQTAREAWAIDGDLLDRSDASRQAVLLSVADTGVTIEHVAPHEGSRSTFRLIWANESARAQGDSFGGDGWPAPKLNLHLRAGPVSRVELSMLSVTLDRGEAGSWDGRDPFMAEMPRHLATFAIRPLDIAIDGVVQGTWWVPSGTIQDQGNIIVGRVHPYMLDEDVAAKGPRDEHRTEPRFVDPWSHALPGSAECAATSGPEAKLGDLWVGYIVGREVEVTARSVSWSDASNAGREGEGLQWPEGLPARELPCYTLAVPEGMTRVLVQLELEPGLTREAVFDVPSLDPDGHMQDGIWDRPSPAVDPILGTAPIVIGLAAGVAVALFVVRRNP